MKLISFYKNKITFALVGALRHNKSANLHNVHLPDVDVNMVMDLMFIIVTVVFWHLCTGAQPINW